MGWRGIMRSAVAAARAAEKAEHQRQKQALKARLFDETDQAVEAWEAYLERLSSIHHEGCTRIDWSGVMQCKAPIPPRRQTKRSDVVRDRLHMLRPSIFHVFKGGSAKVRSKLERELERIEQEEEKQYQADLERHQLAIIDWKNDVEVARKVIDGDPEETKNVLEELTSLSDNELIGKQVRFSISRQSIHAMPEVHPLDIVPTFRRKRLASGRLSETKMPVAEIHERYQDYVASVAFRVAVDILNVLPRSEVHVTCTTRMLNPDTGHVELVPILYVRFIRQTIVTLNLSRIDPSNALSNFIHVMNFKRTKGFSGIMPTLPIA
ncbi:hypothetical protein [Rhizobium binxianense]